MTRLLTPPGDLISRLQDAEKKTRRVSVMDDYDDLSRPGAPTGVTLKYRIREKGINPTFRAVVTWNAIAPGTCEADINFYVVQLRPVKPNGTEIEAGRRKREIVFVEEFDELPEVLRADMGHLEHPKSWCWEARVRVVDKANRRGAWSAWTGIGATPYTPPWYEAIPLPPTPTGLWMDFNKGEKGRDEARYTMKLECDEVGLWDIPPGDQATTEIQRIKLERVSGGTFQITFNGQQTGNLDWNASAFDVRTKLEALGAIEPGDVEVVKKGTSCWEVEFKGQFVGNDVSMMSITTGSLTPGVADGKVTEIQEPGDDEQDEENDVDRYVFQIRRCDASGNWITVTDANLNERFVQRRKDVSAKQEDEDNNSIVKCEFPNIRKRHFWKARVKTVDRFNRHGEWSDWTAVGTPLDTTAPPRPKHPLTGDPGFLLDVDNHRIHLEWDAAEDPDDTDSDLKDPDPDISHFQIEGSDRSDFNKGLSGWWVQDRMHRGHHKTFKRKKHPGPFHFRVRSVDSSGNKSAWVTASANSNVPSTPNAAPTITFDRGGKKQLRAKVAFTYSGAATYTDDDIDKFIVQLQAEDANPTADDPKRKRVHDIDKDESDDPQVVVFDGIKKNEKVRARYKVKDTRGHESGWSAWSTIYTAGGNKKPGKVTGKQVSTKTRAVRVSYTPPTTWSDGTIDGFSLEEVDHYIVVLKGNNGIEITRDSHFRGTQKTFHFTKAEMNALSLPLSADVYAVGIDGDNDGADGGASSASPSEIDAGDLTGSVSYTQMGTLGVSRYGTTAQMNAASAKNGDIWINTSYSPPRVFRYEGGVWNAAIDGSILVAGTVIADAIVAGALDAYVLNAVTIYAANFYTATSQGQAGMAIRSNNQDIEWRASFPSGALRAFVGRAAGNLHVWENVQSLFLYGETGISLSVGSGNVELPATRLSQRLDFNNGTGAAIGSANFGANEGTILIKVGGANKRIPYWN